MAATTPDQLNWASIRIHDTTDLLLLIIAYCQVLQLPAGAPKTALLPILQTLVSNAAPWGTV